MIQKTSKPAIDLKTLKMECPKASAKLEEFMRSALEEFQKIMLEDWKKEGMIEEEEQFSMPSLDGVLIESSMTNLFSEGSIRTLYEFFDREEVYISISAPIPGIGWTWDVSYKNKVLVLNKLLTIINSRVEAEAEAFKQAFKTLESVL